MKPYAPRKLAFSGLREVSGYRLKVYFIVHNEGVFEPSRFESGFAEAAKCLPSPAKTPVRPGVGFVVCHQGETADYFVLCWWDQENELPVRVLLREGEGWRPSQDGESFCVWDFRVMWWEREAYVNTVLAKGTVDAYLAMNASGYA
jgi:hypothetical protein